MEILFWFILGMSIIFGISRYNEDEKLFWKLTVSFLGAFLAGTIAYNYVNSDEQNNVKYLTSAPTQVLFSNSHADCVLAELSELAIPEGKTSKPVSQDKPYGYTSIVLSKALGGIRGQPPQFFDTS